jgi:hypothetical protein
MYSLMPVCSYHFIDLHKIQRGWGTNREKQRVWVIRKLVRVMLRRNSDYRLLLGEGASVLLDILNVEHLPIS